MKYHYLACLKIWASSGVGWYIKLREGLRNNCAIVFMLNRNLHIFNHWHMLKEVSIMVYFLEYSVRPSPDVFLSQWDRSWFPAWWWGDELQLACNYLVLWLLLSLDLCGDCWCSSCMGVFCDALSKVCVSIVEDWVVLYDSLAAFGDHLSVTSDQLSILKYLRRR